MTIYKTSTGVTLEIVRIHRSLIDTYARDNPVPEPPTKEVQVFGGVLERVEDKEDPAYLAQLMTYNLQMANLEFGLIVQAVRIMDPNWSADPRIAEMTSIGMDADSAPLYLRYIALSVEADLVHVMREVQYLSTVTDRGIQEAMQAFSIEWHGVPLQKHRSPPGKLRASLYYQARVAATDLGITWDDFCELPGPLQSTAMAQHQCKMKIEYLASEERKT